VGVALRPLQPADHAAVRAILFEDSVARWWGEVGESLDDEFEDPQAILVDGEFAGVVDLSEENEPNHRHAGLDIVLSAPFQGRGVGRRALALAARTAFEERGHHRVTIDPAATNERAIRCYTAVGFRPVGVLRHYERGRDGTWHDGLLMDMLAGELVFEFS
jgi:aminoglycoside 6'-N-acetyltransferase